MRVSLLVMFSLVGICMSEPQGVRFRDSMLGNIISKGVAGGRGSISDVMGIFSTIGKGMTKMVTPNGSRRKNRIRPNQAQFRQSGERDSGLRPLNDNDVRSQFVKDYDYEYESGPRVPQRPQFDESATKAPQRQRPLRRRPQGQRKRLRQQHQRDDVQRLSNNDILGLANPETNFWNKQQEERKPHFSLQNPSSWFK